MTKREIETSLSHAIDQLPHLPLDAIASPPIQKMCEQDEIITSKIKRQNQKIWGYKLAAVVSFGLVLFVTGAAWYWQNLRVNSSITINVNPSFEIEISKKDRVLKVNALNKDAVEFVDDSKFRRWRVDDAVEELFVELGKSDYMANKDNTIRISIHSKSEKHGQEIEEELTEHIEKALAFVHIKSNIIFQIMDTDLS